MRTFFFVFLSGMGLPVFAQNHVVKDIKWFGAKDNGKTNDHEAFIKAPDFFTKRGGHGKLTLSKGTYVAGKQLFKKNTKSRPVHEGSDLLSFSDVVDLTIEGLSGNLIKDKDSLCFGAFQPETGKPHLHGNNYFVNEPFKGQIGTEVRIHHSSPLKYST